MSINTYDTTFFNVETLFNDYFNSRKKAETKEEDLYTPFFHVDVLFNNYLNSRKKENRTACVQLR